MDKQNDDMITITNMHMQGECVHHWCACVCVCIHLFIYTQNFCIPDSELIFMSALLPLSSLSHSISRSTGSRFIINKPS